MNLSLRKGITWTHFIIYLLAALLSICLFVFLNASQAFILGEVLGVAKAQLGNVSGSLAFYDQILSLFMVLIWGVLSDIFGRKIIYICGFLLSALVSSIALISGCVFVLVCIKCISSIALI